MPFGRGRGQKQNTMMNRVDGDIGGSQLKEVNNSSQPHRQRSFHSTNNNGSTGSHSVEEIHNENICSQRSPSKAISTSTKSSNSQPYVISYGRGKTSRKEFPKQVGTQLIEAEAQSSHESPNGTNNSMYASLASRCARGITRANESQEDSSKQPKLGYTQNSLDASSIDKHEARTRSWSSGSRREETTSSSCGNAIEPNMVPHVADISIMAPKLPSAKVQQAVIVTTNIFPLVVEDRLVYRYDVRVEAEPLTTGRRVIDLCRGSDPDRQRKCMLLLRLALERYRRAREMAYVYDLSTTLFTNQPLDLKEVSQISMEPSDLSEELREMLGGNVRVRIIINECAEYAHTFRLGDLASSVTNDLNAQDHSLRQFLELITTQSAQEAGTHYSFGSGRLFLKDGRRMGMPEVNLGNGRRLVSGVDKGVRFIEGKDGGIVPALVLDCKKALFFDDISLLDLATEIWMRRKARPIPQLKASEFRDFVRYVGRSLSDLMVRHSSCEKPFRISYLSKLPVRDIRTPVSRKHSVPLSEQYRAMNIEIRLDLPAVVLALQNRKVYFPVEVLTVVPGQRVPLYKQTAWETKEIIKLSAVRPNIRFRDILRHIVALNLHEGRQRNEFLAAFGVKVSREPLKVEANRRSLPRITFGGKFTVSADQKTANWKSGRYLSPARIKHFFVLFDDENDKDNVRNFINALSKLARNKGVVLENEPQIERVPCDELEAHLRLLSSDPNNPTFVMYIDDREQSHDDLKLYEALYQIITQHVRGNTMREASEKPRTLENIVNKMNAKNFGQNYRIVPEIFAKNKWIGKGETLVIGYDVCHPESQPTHQRRMGLPHDEPSVVGLSFNGARNPETFIGDYAYHEPRREQITTSIMEQRAYWMVKLFTEHRGRLPKLVIITRDGVSEGQIKMVVEEELDAIKVGIRNYIEHSQEPTAQEPKYVVVIATKRHNKRFFVETEDGQVSNTEPGTVVDHTVTRADVTEVFMQPHRVIQGTGKLPAYTMPINEANMSMEELQSTMMALCYEHQIVNAAISIPEPIFQADEWAKRGRNNFRAFRRTNDLPRNGESMDWNRITDKLCYMNKALEKTRSNA